MKTAAPASTTPTLTPENTILKLPDLVQQIPSALELFRLKEKEASDAREKAIAEVQAKRATAWQVVVELDQQLSELTGAPAPRGTVARRQLSTAEIVDGTVKLLEGKKEGLPASKIAELLTAEEGRVRQIVKGSARFRQEGKGRSSRFLLK